MSSKNKPLYSISGNPNDPHRYDDMIELPPHKSDRHPHMTMENRAAQFSPFAALTGYEAVIEETARQSEIRHDATGNIPFEEIEGA